LSKMNTNQLVHIQPQVNTPVSRMIVLDRGVFVANAGLSESDVL